MVGHPGVGMVGSRVGGGGGPGVVMVGVQG